MDALSSPNCYYPIDRIFYLELLENNEEAYTVLSYISLGQLIHYSNQWKAVNVTLLCSPYCHAFIIKSLYEILFPLYVRLKKNWKWNGSQ